MYGTGGHEMAPGNAADQVQLEFAHHEVVVGADDDVRYTEGALMTVVLRMRECELLIPQNYCCRSTGKHGTTQRECFATGLWTVTCQARLRCGRLRQPGSFRVVPA